MSTLPRTNVAEKLAVRVAPPSSMRVAARKIQTVREEETAERLDAVAVEEPLEIQLVHGPDAGRRRQSIAVTMRTPGHDVELALGFLFSEGILSGFDAVRVAAHAGGRVRGESTSNVVRIELQPQQDVDLDRLKRNFYVTSSCGVCGKASIEAIRGSGGTALPPDGCRIQKHLLFRLPERLRAAQSVFEHTGGLHAAAQFALDGSLERVREDVGRHNALDKLVGAAFIQRALPLDDRLILLSGRASFELVQKAVAAGVPVLAAVGAPSSLAVALAEEFGMTLVGFLRDGRFNIYCGAERVDVT